jgi:hypothetical protein
MATRVRRTGGRSIACGLAALMMALLATAGAGRGDAADRGGTADTLRAGSPLAARLKLRESIERVSTFEMVDTMRVPHSSETRFTRRVVVAGEDCWLVSRLWRSAASADTSFYAVLVNARTFSMMKEWTHASRDSGEGSIRDGRLIGWHVSSGDSAESLRVTIASGAVPASLTSAVVDALPLREGYIARIPTFNMWAHGAEQWVELSVVGEASLRFRGRDVRCWRVRSDGLRAWGVEQEFWVDEKARRLLLTVTRDPRTRRTRREEVQ